MQITCMDPACPKCCSSNNNRQALRLIDLCTTAASLRAGAAFRGSRVIALVDCADRNGSALSTRLRVLGHFPVSFSNIPDFLTATRNGVQFDLLFSSPQVLDQWQLLLAACGLHKLPVVLLINECEQSILTESLSLTQERFKGPVDVNVATLPIMDMELHWRIGLLARPCARQVASKPAVDRQFGGYRFIVSRRRVSLRDSEVHLMPQEFSVALMLFENAGSLIQRDMMLRLIWGKRAGGERSRVLDVCVCKLRKKLSLCAENGFELVSIFRQGYQLRRVTSRSDVQAGAARERSEALQLAPH